MLAFPKADCPRDQSRSYKSFTSQSWKSPAMTSAIVYCSHRLTLIHCGRRLQKDMNTTKWEPSWRLAKVYRVTNKHPISLARDDKLPYILLVFKL